MKISSLRSLLPEAKFHGSREAEILSIAFDSRLVEPGGLFFALAGSRADGNQFVRQAVSAGAVAVLSETPPSPEILSGGASRKSPIAWIEVPDALKAMSRVSAEFYGHPSKKLAVLGVTGTNGKTTTSYLLESILQENGLHCGVLGTVNYRIDGVEVEKAPNTTPASLDLQRLLAKMAERKNTHAVMEVSSHALSLSRVEDVFFDAAVLTNLHQDHLDFHKTRENYFQAKANLFRQLALPDNPKKNRFAVLNNEEETFERLKPLLGQIPIFSFGMHPGATLWASEVNTNLQGTLFRLHYLDKEFPVRLRLVGKYNVWNALAAAASGLGFGLSIGKTIEGVERLRSVPGRLEPVEGGVPFGVFVDFAHTENALKNVLETLQGLPHRRILTVFGCGGDRDRSKRGPMGVTACKLSDEVFVTSDNPRFEDPHRILRDIETGIKTAGLQNYRMVPDRAEAIFEALRSAKEGDAVLLAGKGHENSQIVRGENIPFSDVLEARRALKSIFKTEHPHET